ncbi:MAG: nucleotidyl transferase AbiEii/AbiGii toxin family protein [Candidatus Nanohaloarchaea archaeon]|nr:nucleotidyl transferase AbiEii/AbiGii toxin family protein [Candidatus Nanohaloarchaea archaeon]
MLSRRQIERVSRTLTDGNAGHAEKLYLQDVILSTVGRETVDELVFKGGTALLKFYQLDRFSEDLDFTLREELDLDELVRKVVRDLENYGATVEDRDVEEGRTTFKTRLGIQGPLYTGERRSLCFVRVEVNKKSSVDGSQNLRYTPKFKDITGFELSVLSQEEILAEKIRAMVIREEPRDLYDIYHLLENGVGIDPELVQEKLDYYDEEYKAERVMEEAGKVEKNWDSLETLVFSALPEFDRAVEVLEESLPGEKS